ncbi:MAG TPA: TIGR01906 family membrane protein [Anaerolineales bacterium]|nr:TIGR01906 family membrane protein [Anaerolineales bacterium]
MAAVHRPGHTLSPHLPGPAGAGGITADRQDLRIRTRRSCRSVFLLAMPRWVARRGRDDPVVATTHRLWYPTRMKHARLLHILVVLALPLALLAVSLRATTGPWLVHWEYGKADFPPDPYGLTAQERIRLAETCVDYLTTGAEIDLLADLRLPEGGPAFNERELGHMVDVKRVFWAILWAGLVTGVVAVGGVVALAARPATRPRAPVALLGGSLLTLGLLVGVGGLMLARWEVFFTGFHELLFPPGTWTFPTSDTLIRLYPERFWMDVGAVVVGLLVVQAGVIGTGALLWRRFEVHSSKFKVHGPPVA